MLKLVTRSGDGVAQPVPSKRMIEHTARHAADLGYEVVVASDGTSTVNDEWQRAGLNYALTNVGRTPTCAEIISALRG